jgi:UDP-N-acetylmuramate dehydrogenase
MMTQSPMPPFQFDSRRLRGKLSVAEPLSAHTTWRVGGPADYYYKPADSDDLAEVLGQWPADAPLFWLGLGSNLLVRDGGMRGLVIAIGGMLNDIERVDGDRVRVEAGVSCPKVARFCARQGLVGAEFLAGIPGTMGGALAMNAGAFGGETWPLVDSVETVDRRGARHRRVPADFDIAYRHVRGPEGEWFIAATLALAPGDGAASQAQVKALLGQRGDTQPTGQPSGGSVFRNPPGDHAGRLIESCGLKGFAIGAARVSDKHANFFINTGAATAADIEALIRHVQQVVETQTGVRLVPEVHIVGETATGGQS